MKGILLFILFVLSLGQVQSQNLTTVRYKGLESRGGGKKPSKICVYMDIPVGFKTSKFNGIHFGEDGISFIYPDGSELFISNAFYDGTSINVKNRSYSNQPRIADLDSLNSFGIQENKLLWREFIVGKVAVGYLNVPPEKKEQYEKALATLRRKKK